MIARAAISNEIERFTRLEDPDGGSQVVRFQRRTQTLDGIVCARRDVPECAPVVGYEDASVQPLEERQRVVVGEVPATKPLPLPPWSVTDRQQRDVELPLGGG
jgi:hypothetical protein